jgi:hypothetical protein
MRGAHTVLGVALCTAWVGQAWTASLRPDPAAQAQLLDRLENHLEGGDELAYLPGWELGWAIQLERRFGDHSRRLGIEDLGRPSARIWVISSPDAPPVPAALGTVRETLSVGRLKAERYAVDGPVVSLIDGWAHAGCRLTSKRTTCASSRGSIRRSELIFDGRFAHGHKVTLKDNAVFNLAWTPSSTGRLVGGVGHTDHGARHGLSPVEVRVIQAGKELARWRLKGVTGLRPVAVAVVAGEPVELRFSTAQGERNEVALSVGFAP